MSDLTFSYKNRPFLMLFVILIGVLFSALFFYMAMYDDDLELSFLGFYAAGWEATALAWFFGVFMAALGLFGIYGLLASFRKPNIITLTDTVLVAPKAPISKTLITVPYDGITKLQREDVLGQVFLQVHHSGGKLSISKNNLADKSGFEDIERELHARWDAATGVNVS